MQDLEEYRRTHDNVNVKIHEENSLGQFCAQVRHARKNILKDSKMKLTKE
jgi:hypothetical protein